jgi:hypothetical protein
MDGVQLDREGVQYFSDSTMALAVGHTSDGALDADQGPLKIGSLMWASFGL